MLQPSFLVAGLLFLFAGGVAFTATVFVHDPEFDALIPPPAYEGVGVWSLKDQYIATGHSGSVESFGAGKDKSLEQIFAEKDAKYRILLDLASATNRDFDPGSYDLSGEISGFRIAAVYHIEGRQGVFLIGVAKKNQVALKLFFNPAKARLTAFRSFDDGKFKDAAAKLALLTQKGIQDEETISYARAAAWHVNLDSGIVGAPRTDALRALGQFYFDHRAYEASLDQFYALYLETQMPEISLLEKLVVLCQNTSRNGTARKFQSEIDKQSAPVRPSLKSATIDPFFEPILSLQPILLKNGGARLLTFDGNLYFVAVGTTEMREPSSNERLRQLRVGRVQAQKQAVAFFEETKVVAEEKFVQSTVITTKDGKKSAQIFKTIDETTATRVHGVLNSLSDIGTWSNADGTLFFFAIGKKLN